MPSRFVSDRGSRRPRAILLLTTLSVLVLGLLGMHLHGLGTVGRTLSQATASHHLVGYGAAEHGAAALGVDGRADANGATTRGTPAASAMDVAPAAETVLTDHLSALGIVTFCALAMLFFFALLGRSEHRPAGLRARGRDALPALLGRTAVFVRRPLFVLHSAYRI